MAKDLVDTSKFTDLQQALLQALAHPDSKGDLRKAMKMAGYAPTTHTSVILANPELKKAIVDLAMDMLASTSVKAVGGLIDVLENPHKPGANNKIVAAKEILDRVGVIKKDVATGPTITAKNIFILPAKGAIIDADYKIVREAATDDDSLDEQTYIDVTPVEPDSSQNQVDTDADRV